MQIIFNSINSINTFFENTFKAALASCQGLDCDAFIFYFLFCARVSIAACGKVRNILRDLNSSSFTFPLESGDQKTQTSFPLCLLHVLLELCMDSIFLQQINKWQSLTFHLLESTAEKNEKTKTPSISCLCKTPTMSDFYCILFHTQSDG